MASLASVALVVACSTLAAAGADARPADPRWAAIRAVFHQGETEGPYFRINLPRTDLHVRIGNDAAVHNHMVDDAPRMYWIHWYATGDGPALARGVAAALARTNSERRSGS